MISERLAKAINQQVNAELWSAYLYLSMSVHFASDGKPGISNWFQAQFHEEQEHAQRLINYLVSQDAKPELLPIDKVATSWESPLAAFEETLSHEKVVTGLIKDLYQIATEDQDYATQSMLKWFIDEQIEEEDTAKGLIDALMMIGDNGFGLYTFDKELASRTFVSSIDTEK